MDRRIDVRSDYWLNRAASLRSVGLDIQALHDH